MDTVTGYVERITYRNEENGYTVLALSDAGKETVLTGVFPALSEGEFIRAEGELVVHPVYGEQMKVERYEFITPTDRASIEKYLSSGAVKGIGPALASRIVAKFGDDTFRIMEEEPERLAEVRGISERSAMAIAERVIEKREIRSAVIFLQQYGMTFNMAAKIYREYGMKLYGIVRENPYQLSEDIEGIGFRTADQIAQKNGILPDSEFRIRAGILYTLSQAVSFGHTYLPKEELLTAAEELLAVQIAEFDHILQELSVKKKIHIRRDGTETQVYLNSFYRMELDSARILRDMNLRDEALSDDEIDRKLQLLQQEKKITLDPLQHEAAHVAVKNGISIITGGPGTGKTTIINLIITYFLREGLDILLAAPTGRAAKRMTEATGYEAQTIHRMLEVSGNPAGGSVFQRNSEMPLEADVVIIDEMSMVDTMLMHALLRAMVPGMRLVLVGDVNQLPSVGPGEVLKSLIDSDCFPVVRLTRIFRQAEESDIIVNAHRINEGEIVEKKPSKDFLFILRDEAPRITGATITLLREKLPPYVHADISELQVLTPMRKGLLGVENLNKVLQEALNPPSPKKVEKEFSFGIFREGDKVMQIKNDYQITWEMEGTYPKKTGTGIFNGDMGVIRRISFFEETITVLFDEEKIVVYPFSAVDSLELAYAVTIHKSQGSEYPAVIIPLLSGPQLLMTRNLLYTGVTRAKQCVCIVGSYDTFCRMIRNDREQKRYSGLRDMIRELYGDH
ncbi:MAG: ATP-dependent RecD-like DNA helicase [Lachnospiraceae bacterium]|nr:ATP-dependent RecD-like DNA helicase [Lachnospiraceae bacterium]